MAMISAESPRQRVAVLSKKDLRTHPYADWLAPARREILLFAQADKDTRLYLAEHERDFETVHLFDDWKANRSVDLAVVREHRKRPLHRIVALSECDQLRAGQLRERLGLPGQDALSAKAFRDKALMKQCAESAGLAVPAFTRADTPWAVLDFAARHSHRVVVKPLDGAGSLDVVAFDSHEPLLTWVNAQRSDDDEPARLLIEEYVDAPMLVVDGVMAGGQVRAAMVSGYDPTCHRAMLDLRPLGVLQLAPEDPRTVRALAYVDRLLEALPCPADPTSFHCELFDHAQRGILLCEIACRTGGGRTNDSAVLALGVDLEQCSFLGQAGVSQREPLQLSGRLFVGTVDVLRPGRTLLRGPDDCPVPGVVEFRMHNQPGEFVQRARKVSECVADVLMCDSDAHRLADTFQAVVRWLDGEFVWA